MVLKNNPFDFVFCSKSFDPYENLAIEDYLLRQKKYQSLKILFLWQSKPAVVLGRFQNPWLECDLKNCQSDGVHIVRRQSGGGTVYHDLGNLNISCIGKIDKKENFEFVIEALSKLGIKAYVNERNDILINGLKISGSAFKKTKDSEIHHMTLLVDAKVQTIKKYLHHKQASIKSKSIKSHRSEMTCLKSELAQIKTDDVMSMLKANILEFPDMLSVIESHEVSSKENFYRSWEWVFGETPRFEVDYKGEQVTVIKGLLSGQRFKNL